MRYPERYPDPLVARAKAARKVGINVKVIARYTGANVNTICGWFTGALRPHVAPDPEFEKRFAALFRHERVRGP